MIDIQPARLTQLVLVRRYRRTPVRTLQFAFEEKFTKYMGGALMQSTNVPPGAPPEIPSYAMSDTKRQLQVSELACVLTLNFDLVASSISPLSKLLRQPSELFDSAVDSIFETQTEFFSGISAVYNYPRVSSLADGSTFLMDIFSAIKSPVAPVSFQQSIAWEESGKYINIEASLYNKFEISGIVGQPNNFDMEFADASEIGIQIKLDVNTRPLRGNLRKFEVASLVDPINRLATATLPELTNNKIRIS